MWRTDKLFSPRTYSQKESFDCNRRFPMVIASTLDDLCRINLTLISPSRAATDMPSSLSRICHRPKIFLQDRETQTSR